MHWWIEQAHCYGTGRHDLEQSAEIAALHHQELVECCLPRLLGLGENHLDDVGKTFRVVEHTLGAHQADALGAIFERAARVRRRIGVGEDLKATGIVSPRKQRRQLLGKSRRQHRHFAQIDVARCAVDADCITLDDRVIANPGGACAHIDFDTLRASNARLAHAARYDGGVGCLAAARCQNAFRGKEAVNVLGLRFLAHENDGGAIVARLFGTVGIEDGYAGSGAR